MEQFYVQIYTYENQDELFAYLELHKCNPSQSVFNDQIHNADIQYYLKRKFHYLCHEGLKPYMFSL